MQSIFIFSAPLYLLVKPLSTFDYKMATTSVKNPVD